MKNFVRVIVLAVLITIMGCSKYPELGSGYEFNNDGRYTLSIVDSNNNIVVAETILEYAFDSTFIIASQRPWDSIPNIRTMNYRESNKAFDKSTFRQYWIINKKKKSVYAYNEASKKATYSNVFGPFKKEEYLLKRKELGVPDNLRLKSE